MGRYRSRSRSRSHSPVRRSKHYDDPRDRHRGGDPGRSGLLVRNLPLTARNEDLRIPFERYGSLKDVYIPKNYYTGDARGFGFVKFRHAEDAAKAKERLNHTVIGGREIRIVYAEENRKTPQEMRRITGTSSRSSHRRRSPSRSPRRRNHSYSRSPSPARHEPRDHGGRDAHVSSSRYRSVSRSASPKNDKAERSPRRSRSISKSPPRSKKDDVRSRSRSVSKSPRSKQGDVRIRSRSISYSPPLGKKGDVRSHRYSNPKGNGHEPRDEDHMPDQSPITQRNSRSRSRSRSITKSPR